ncbi:type I toxin-antitoxin system Hok family toxin [Escherichia coli]|nr:type I toxin-antitoxin system Hok family toxin [Escherichia coli]
MTKYALIGLLAVCATVLCFSLIFRERLCELNIGEPAEFGKNRTLRFSGHP